ncbi:MAG: hypothetical protein H8E73_03000 [Planctomycetes bacterium]|nr:hypothetical protein [Planctomycetota bacterium]
MLPTPYLWIKKIPCSQTVGAFRFEQLKDQNTERLGCADQVVPRRQSGLLEFEMAGEAQSRILAPWVATWSRIALTKR